MPREKEQGRAKHGNGRPQCISNDSQSPNQIDAEDEVCHPFQKNHHPQGTMLTHAKQNLVRCRLSYVESRGNQQDQQNAITRGVALADPNGNRRFAQQN